MRSTYDMRCIYLLVAAASLVRSQAAPASPFSTTFNSSFSLSDSQKAAANLTDTLTDSVNTVLNFDRSSLANGGPRQDDFYTLPTLHNTTDLKPGQVLKIQEMTGPDPFAIPPGSALSRLLYTTETLNGTVVPASAFILWPFEPRQFSSNDHEQHGKKRKAAAVLWTHGTSGYFADQAPSSHRTLYYGNIMPLSLAQAGYAVVGPDYAGLGVGQSWDGSDIPHQYFAMPAGAHDALFAMQASVAAFGDRLDGTFAVLGHSQGGGVAWAVAELIASLKDSYGSLRHLIKGYVGTIAFSPVTKTLSGPSFVDVMVGMNLGSIFPDFTAETWLTPLGVSRLKLLQEVQGGAGVAQELLIPPGSVEEFIKPDWYNATYHARAFEKLANVGGKPVASPMLVVQGTEDPFANAQVTRDAVAKTCKLGPENKLHLLVAEGFGHTPPISALRSTWMDWLEERFQGTEIENACVTAEYSGWLGTGQPSTASNSFEEWAGALQYTYQNPGAV